MNDIPTGRRKDITGRSCSTRVCDHGRQLDMLRRDLHDVFGPILAEITMGLDVALRMLEDDRSVSPLLSELRTDAADFLAEFRGVLSGFGAVDITRLGVEAGLRDISGRLERATGGTLSISVEITDPGHFIHDRQQIAAYWIVREALTNVLRHAGATKCSVRLRVEAGLWIQVHDNGTGMMPGQPSGVGMVSMRSRAAELGGWCEARDSNGPGEGLTVRAFLPAPDLPGALPPMR